ASSGARRTAYGGPGDGPTSTRPLGGASRPGARREARRPRRPRRRRSRPRRPGRRRRPRRRGPPGPVARWPGCSPRPARPPRPRGAGSRGRARRARRRWDRASPATGWSSFLLVPPACGLPSCPADSLEGGEPEGDLAIGGLGGVGAVDEVLQHLQPPVPAEVAPDRAGRGRRRVGRAGERAEPLDHPVPLDDGGHHGAGAHELDQRLVERLADVLGVVAGEQVGVGDPHVEGDQRVALGLDAPQDLTGQPAADAVGLDEDQGALGGDVLAHGFNLSSTASRSARSSSMRRPSTSATTQIAAKTVPMTNIVGTTTPEAISSSCTAEPSQMPDGRRTRPAATTHSSASPPATPQIGPTLVPGSRSPKATSAANSTTKTSKVSTAEHSTARAERRRGRAAGEELTRSGYGLDRGSSRRRGPASG